jgi:archaellum component FlaF (FlaF/FlaG flagellin family)
VLDRLAPATVTATASAANKDEVQITLHNTGQVAALENKLTLLHTDGTEVLPAYYSDNYVSLLPGEERVITISLPASDRTGGMRLGLRGWNAVPVSITVP